MYDNAERLAAELIALSPKELAEVLMLAGLENRVHALERLLVPFREYERHRDFLEQGGVAYDHGRFGKAGVGHFVFPEGTRAWSAPMVKLPNGSMFVVATVGSTLQRRVVPLEETSG